MARRVIVVGAGVVGLSCAVALAESTPLMVDVMARDLPGERPSALAPVPWLPPPARFGEDGVRWARRTREHLVALAEDPQTGVRTMPGRLFGTSTGGSADTSAIPRPPDVQLVDAPVVWPPDYLRHLVRRLLAAGGTLTRMSLPVLPPRGLVVNCTGLASRALVPDLQVEPRTRMQLRLPDPGLTGWSALDDLYAVPHREAGTVTVVGTQPPDAPDDPDGAELLGRIARLEPQLAGSRVLDRRIAVLAHRPTAHLVVRHEAERTMVHCYGHGSSATALSWGCAEDVVTRLAQLDPPTGRTAVDDASRGLW